MKPPHTPIDEGESGRVEGGDAAREGDADTIGAGTPSGARLARDEVFELLSNRRRRDVLLYLDAQPDGTATLDTLAEHIAARENDVTVGQLSAAQRKRVYIGLYQCHLPKMDDLGVIEYDQDRGTVELQDISQFSRYLYR
jgi:hypothetical protein